MGSCFKGSISIHSMTSSVIQTYSLVVKKKDVGYTTSFFIENQRGMFWILKIVIFAIIPYNERYRGYTGEL